MEPDISQTETNQPEERPADSAMKKRPWGRAGVWIGLFALLALLGAALMRSQSGPVEIGKTAPDFTLTSYDGRQRIND